MSAVVIGPAQLDPCPTLSLRQRTAVGALVYALDHPTVQNLTTAFCAIAAAVDLTAFGLALLSANSRILFLADSDSKAT